MRAPNLVSARETLSGQAEGGWGGLLGSFSQQPSANTNQPAGGCWARVSPSLRILKVINWMHCLSSCWALI